MNPGPIFIIRLGLLFFVVTMLLQACGGNETPAGSSWAGDYDNGSGMKLALVAGPDGSLSGELLQRSNGKESRFPVKLKLAGDALEGSFASGADAYPLRVEAGEDPGQIVITSEGATYELSRVGGGSNNPLVASRPARDNPLNQPVSDIEQAQVDAPRTSGEATVAAETPAQKVENRHASGRRVVINGQRIDDVKLRSLEGPAPTIPDGNYWYDNKSGMAGNINGPTEAYLAAGLDLGGPLAADASGGQTDVAFNGRYLHPIDLSGLEYYFGPIMPGRYWLDGSGNYGTEGGPQEGNLVEEIAVIEMYAAAMQSQMQAQYQAQLQAQVQAYGGQGGYYGQGGGYYDQGGGSVYSHFPNLGASGTGVGVADLGGGDSIVNAGGVLWWPGK